MNIGSGWGDLYGWEMVRNFELRVWEVDGWVRDDFEKGFFMIPIQNGLWGG